MDTKNNTKKRKKILWLSTFLILAVVVVSFVIHLRINGALLSDNTQDIINKYKETLIESVHIPGFIEPEKTVVKDEENAKKVLELQGTISELQKKLERSNSSTTNYTQALNFVVAGSLLVNQLQSNEPFAKQIEALLRYSPKPLLKSRLERIAPYSETGIKTQEDLLKDYQKVYQQTYSSYLKTNPSFIAKVKSYLLYLVFVKKTHNELLADDTAILSKLANVETYLRKNDLKNAYAEFIKIEVLPSSYAEQWMRAMRERLEANEVLSEINSELNNYINLGSK